jgi:hypothetical protein
MPDDTVSVSSSSNRKEKGRLGARCPERRSAASIRLTGGAWIRERQPLP